MAKSDENHQQKLASSLRLLAKTSLIVMMALFISKLLTYGYRILIARYYGPEVYGLFSLVTMILGFIITFSSIGLLDGLARFIPQYRGKKENNRISYLISLTSKILLATGIFSAVLLYLLSDFIASNIFHNTQIISLLKIASFFLPIAVLSNIFLVTLRGHEFISIYSFIGNIMQNVAKLLVLLVLIWLGFDASSTVISYCFGFLAILVCAYLVCRYKLPEIFLKSSLSSKNKKEVRKSFFSYSFPLLFFGMVSLLFYWVDSLFLGYFKGAESVGFYNAAVPIALFLAVMPELFMQLFFPMINRHYSNKDFKLIDQISKQIGKWIFMVNFPIFILIFIFPGAAINILFGSQYLVAETALRILIFGSFIASVGLISNNLLSMAGKSKLVLADIIIAAIANVVLNIILIPAPFVIGLDNSSGINGAAIATVLSILFLNALFFFQAKKYLGIIPLRAKAANILLMGLIPAMILFYARTIIVSQNIYVLALLALAFLAAYVLLVLLSRSLDENDLGIIRAIKQKFTKTNAN